MGDAPQSEQFPPYYLLTYPRTCSNLLVRMLALDEQPKVLPNSETAGYFFMPNFKLALDQGLWAKHVDELSEEEVTKMKQSQQSCADTFGQHITKARSQGKGVLVKEHATMIPNPVALTKYRYGPDSTAQKLSDWSVDPGPEAFNEKMAGVHSDGNVTFLPDRFLRACKPIFLIRSPMAAYPSFYRASVELNFLEKFDVIQTFLTLHWNRTLYDWYKEQFETTTTAQNGDVHNDQNASWPIVLDADDVMTEPGVLLRLCEITGLDATKLRFSWDQADKEKLESMDHIHQRMLSSLLASSGIDKSKTSANLNIETEAKKWKEEFGEEQGTLVEKCVRDAMPDYEYLKSKRLRPAAQ
ncbi:hypothetical protein PHISCL_08438 [Aspergillus sclerotialis]|uniref:Sulfotransferase family n=1 Tax=Aspergillus sclerotialis TaxID=2070753 RepID=A0A3A2ZQ65_9EURO|nr:hypothetical protein PHISCL_08438 [Aspergillus sclerotialis]